MRFKSLPTDNYVVYAVSGVNSISFAIDGSKASKKGLLGFSVKRKDPHENQEYYMLNTKVFKEVIPKPVPNAQNSSYNFPIQSFVWDDFTAKENREYEYSFYPVTGTPKNLTHHSPIVVKVQTEPLYANEENSHDVFFNRGVASSQAYALKFGNQQPDKIKDKKLQEEAFKWLRRNLLDALLKFIQSARKGDILQCCFYEFRYLPVLQELKNAITRGVDVHIIYDAKDNGKKVKGKLQKAFPKVDNLATIKDAKIPKVNLTPREANKNSIQHNKFMVLTRKGDPKASEVWFGSTNISEGGIHGQTNVGHWIRDEKVAESFREYWGILKDDPGMQEGDSAAKRKKDNKDFKEGVTVLTPDLKIATDPKKVLKQIATGETCFFSPRSKQDMLETYSKILDASEHTSCITLAFGISDVFKKYLKDNVAQDHITFLLLEKKDAPKKTNKDTFVSINSLNNVYKAYGAYLDDPLYQWTKEVDTQTLGLNTHVRYVHSKFLLADPLSADPIVITGSANFSKPSTVDNDEDMVMIKGNLRVADIYYTEFMRIFNHYYFRSVMEELKNSLAKSKGDLDEEQRVFLCPDDEWLDKYKPNTFRAKRVNVFVNMEKAVTLP